MCLTDVSLLFGLDASNETRKLSTARALDFVAHHIRKMLGAMDISLPEAKDLKAFRESLKSKPSIHYQGVWETVVKAQQIYDTWKKVAREYLPREAKAKKIRQMRESSWAVSSLDERELQRRQDQARQKRSVELIAGIKEDKRDSWLIWSSGKDQEYKVERPQECPLSEFLDRSTCTCLDFVGRRLPCKHIHAVSTFLQQGQKQMDLEDKADPSDPIDLTQDDINPEEVIDLTQEEIPLSDLDINLSQEDIDLNDLFNGTRYDSSLFDTAPFDTTLVDTTLVDTTRYGSTRYGSTRHGSTRYGSTRNDSTRYGSTRYGSTRHNSTYEETSTGRSVQPSDPAVLQRTRLDLIRERLDTICSIDNEPLELIESAVWRALDHTNTIKRRKTSYN